MNIPVTLIFIILFISILSFYVINLNDVILLTDSSFTFLTMLNNAFSKKPTLNDVLY